MIVTLVTTASSTVSWTPDVDYVLTAFQFTPGIGMGMILTTNPTVTVANVEAQSGPRSDILMKLGSSGTQGYTGEGYRIPLLAGETVYLTANGKCSLVLNLEPTVNNA